jgi:multiple sugar transport system permease protein
MATNAPPRMVGQRRGLRGVLGSVASYTALGIATGLFLVPFYLLVRNGLSTDLEITAPDWRLFPRELHWENLRELFNDPMVPMARSLLNSAVVAVLQTTGTLLLSAMAGYGLARIPFRHANKIFYAVLVTLMIPSAITFVPLFVVVSTLGWVSDLRGLIIPGLFSGFATFLCRQYFLNFPRDLEEAGRVDGLAYWGVFWRIVIPNSGNFLAAIGVITFVASWNSFLWPLVIGQDPSSWTVQVALSTYLTAQTIEIAQLFAGAAVSIVPLLCVFLFLQRYLVQGVAQTGIKG